MRNEELFKEKPVWSAILTLAIPSVLSILVMMLYNMADAPRGSPPDDG